MNWRFTILMLTCVAIARAASTTQLSLTTVSEEGHHQIQATLLSAGKPVENATISFGVKRTFGTLVLGEDKTLDDGTAAVNFPVDLPGNARGEIEVVAQVKAPQQFASVQTAATFSGAKYFTARSEPLPRALWAPHAPPALVIPIVVLVGGVWVTYAFVVAQVLAIRRGGKS